MKLCDVKLGFDHQYIDEKTGRKCYIAAIHADDGACLIIELYDVDGEDHSGELRMSEACFLEPISGAKS